jgi:hypothetical protein
MIRVTEQNTVPRTKLIACSTVLGTKVSPKRCTRDQATLYLRPSLNHEEVVGGVAFSRQPPSPLLDIYGRKSPSELLEQSLKRIPLRGTFFIFWKRGKWIMPSNFSVCPRMRKTVAGGLYPRIPGWLVIEQATSHILIPSDGKYPRMGKCARTGAD